jgi:hypothetical protein
VNRLNAIHEEITKWQEFSTFAKTIKDPLDFTGEVGQNMADIAAKKIATLRDELVKISPDAARAAADLQKLYDILKRQTAEESKNKPDPVKELATRQQVATKNATDTVKELNQQYAVLYKAPYAKEWGMLQVEISKQIENFRDSLTRTELPAAKVTELTNNYAAALRRVKEETFKVAQQTSLFQAFEGVFARSLDRGLDEWINTVIEGKNQLEALRDVGKAVANDLLKTFITLAALNPLKNALFGTNYKELGGSAGIGGLLGDLFKGATASAQGGMVGSFGRIPLRQYAGGGIARGPQLSLFGEGDVPEAYVPVPSGKIPVQLSGGGAPTIEFHVHEAPGTRTEQKTSPRAGGGTRIDVWVKTLAKEAMLEDFASGGSVAQTGERRYGWDRTRGMAS